MSRSRFQGTEVTIVTGAFFVVVVCHYVTASHPVVAVIINNKIKELIHQPIVYTVIDELGRSLLT